VRSTRESRVDFESYASRLERRITNTLLGFSFIIGLAFFSTMLFSHGNTFSIVEPIVRWCTPNVSDQALAVVHNAARKMGHFFIPAVAFWVLVLGPLRNRPITALLACAAFACVDEAFQTFSPGRNGSILDVMLDTTGALFGFFVHAAIRAWRATRPAFPRQS
jgi:VanZ family protein